MDQSHDDGEASRLLDGLRRSLEAEYGSGEADQQAEKVSAMTIEDVRRLHDELLRRSSDAPDASPAEHQLLDIVRRDLVGRRLAAEVAAIQAPVGVEPPKEESSRRRILATLQAGPATGTELTRDLGLARETVTRILTALAGEGYLDFAVDPHDRRRKLYSLGPSGRDLLVQSERVLGVAGPAARIQPSVEADYLQSATRRAVELRRLRYDLPHAEERLRGIVPRAGHIGRPDIEVLARRELITTLRHAGKWTETMEQIRELEDLATSGRIDAACVAPALAHVDYEQGRLPSTKGSPLAERARSLTSAVSDFDRLAKATSGGVENWSIRGAWAMTGLAEVLREQTEFGKAIFQAQAAQQVFQRHEDLYGLARTLFLQGFCDRLRGKYSRARSTLSEALDLSTELGSDRWQAHAHMQLGDVSRCLERYDDAQIHLSLALELTNAMPMPLTKAFALSALGATRYATEDFPAAAKYFEEAHTLFEACDHPEGLALNTRRHAVALRSMRKPEQALVAAMDAYRAYRGVQSPAGITASLVEIIEDRIASGVEINDAVTILGRYIVRPSPRRLIELDPSAPQLVDALFQRLEAEERLQAVDRALVEESARLLQAAKDRIVEDHGREADILDALDGGPELDEVDPVDRGRRSGAHPAAVQWEWFDDDDPESAEIYDRQNVMGVEPRREAERQIAA